MYIQDEQLSDHIMRLLFIIFMCIGGYYFQKSNDIAYEDAPLTSEYSWCQQACEAVALPVVLSSEKQCICGGTGIVRDISLYEY